MNNYFVEIVVLTTLKTKILNGAVVFINHNGQVKFGGVAANKKNQQLAANFKDMNVEMKLVEVKIFKNC